MKKEIKLKALGIFDSETGELMHYDNMWEYTFDKRGQKERLSQAYLKENGYIVKEIEILIKSVK